jgi:hypothetical protein
LQGSPATLAQIKSGQQVYSYVERDPKTLDSIDVGPVRADSTPSAPDKPARKPKKTPNNN